MSSEPRHRVVRSSIMGHGNLHVLRIVFLASILSMTACIGKEAEKIRTQLETMEAAYVVDVTKVSRRYNGPCIARQHLHVDVVETVKGPPIEGMRVSFYVDSIPKDVVGKDYERVLDPAIYGTGKRFLVVFPNMAIAGQSSTPPYILRPVARGLPSLWTPWHDTLRKAWQ